MQIQFREFNPFSVWIWLEFSNVPSEMEKQYVEEVLNSWFFIGKLGGFNAENMQVQEAGLEIGYMEYDEDVAETSLLALMHNMGDVEYEGGWARCWFDLGTTDYITPPRLPLRVLRCPPRGPLRLRPGGAGSAAPAGGDATPTLPKGATAPAVRQSRSCGPSW